MKNSVTEVNVEKLVLKIQKYFFLNKITQRAWRCYTNRKIYKYYRDLVLLKTFGNPSQLLKAFNPNEAQLLDNSLNCFIRFRLGGEKFPPTVYYKIFLNKGLCDLNSFAPRDYSGIRRQENNQEGKIYYKEYKEKKIWHDGWYLREENNGWRPLEVKPVKKKDPVETVTAQKVKYHHYNKDFRSKKKEKQRRLVKFTKKIYIKNKLRWFQTMFEKAKEQEPVLKNQPNPFEESKYFDLDEDEFQKEVNDLIEWSENLDFDKYVDGWMKLSTSDNSHNYLNGVRKTYMDRLSDTNLDDT